MEHPEEEESRSHFVLMVGLGVLEALNVLAGFRQLRSLHRQGLSFVSSDGTQ